MCPMIHKSESGQSEPASNLQSSLPSQAAAPDPTPVTTKPKWKAPPPVRMRNSDPFQFDEAFTRRLVRFLDPLMRTYFRAELRGSENFLSEQAIVVAERAQRLGVDQRVGGQDQHERLAVASEQLVGEVERREGAGAALFDRRVENQRCPG